MSIFSRTEATVIEQVKLLLDSPGSRRVSDSLRGCH